MPNKYNPGCDCCDPTPCPDLLESEDSDPPITKLEDAETYSHRVIGKIELPDATAGRLYLGYLDNANFLYVECLTDTATDADDGALRIGVIASGANTVLQEIDPYPVTIGEYVFGSYHEGMLTGGLSAKSGLGELVTYTAHLSSPATAPGGLVGASEFLTYSGLSIPYTSRLGGFCPPPFYSCCGMPGADYADYEIPDTVTLTIAAGGGDPWTGSWVLPLMYDANGCAWGYPNGTGPFTQIVIYANHQNPAFKGLQCTIIDGTDFTFANGHPTYKNCIDWFGESLAVQFGSSKSPVITLDL